MVTPVRVFVDSSTLIALSRIGELEFLKDLFHRICITKTIEGEISRYDFPETQKIKEAIGGWIEVVEVSGDAGRFTKFGLDEGEATLFLTDMGDMLIIDELNARRMAEVERRAFTGLLGLIVASAERGKITRERALSIIDKLVESNFRLSSELYREAKKRIEKVR